MPDSNHPPHAPDLRFPIGPFQRPGQPLNDDQRTEAIRRIAGTPAALRDAVADLDAAQLDTPYRPGGWTVRQVVHHLPDSHVNSYTRFRLALTETEPAIRAYHEARWATLPDARTGPIGWSLDLLAALHVRWVALLESLEPLDWARRLRHPEMGVLRLDELLALYAWHGPHHVAHITALRRREGW